MVRSGPQDRVSNHGPQERRLIHRVGFGRAAAPFFARDEPITSTSGSATSVSTISSLNVLS